MELVDAFGVAGLSFLLKKFVDFLKLVRGGDMNGVVTQAGAWAAGIGLFFLASASKAFGSVDIGEIQFSDFDWATKVLAGLVIGSVGSVVADNSGTALAKLTSLPSRSKVTD